MTTKREQALKDLEATCEDLADLDEAFERGRLQGLEESAKAMCFWCNWGLPIAGPIYGRTEEIWHIAYPETPDDKQRVRCEAEEVRKLAAAIREKIKGAAVGEQEENTQ